MMDHRARDQCTFCKSTSYVLSHGIVVERYKEGARVSNHLVCLTCGRQWREFVFPAKDGLTSTVERRVITYDTPKPRSIEGMAVIFQQDLDLYQGWNGVIDELLEQVNKQMAARTYSNMAMHFLRTTQIVLKVCRSLAERRIRSVNDWFKGQSRT
jgi:hypothetical protein